MLSNGGLVLFMRTMKVRITTSFWTIGDLRLVDLLDLVGRQVGVGPVDRAVEQRQHAGRGLLGRADGDLAHRLGIVLPAEEVALEDLHVEDIPAAGSPRGRSCRRPSPRRWRRASALPQSPSFSLRLDDARIDDADRGDRGEERRVGGLELEAHEQRLGRRHVLGLQDLRKAPAGPSASASTRRKL